MPEAMVVVADDERRSRLTPIDGSCRLAAVREVLAERRLDALVVTHPPNIRWLTGFTGSAGVAVLERDGDSVTLLTDGRYEEQASLEARAVGIELDLRITRDLMVSLPAERVGFDSRHLSVADHALLAEKAPGELVDAAGLVEELRQEKASGEIERLALAAEIADASYAEIWPLLAEGGMAERDVAAELEFRMRRLGADGLSFDSIVASGPNGARPHARPGSRILEPGDLVVLDFGAAVEGYGSDMTRTVAVAGRCDDRSRELYEAVRTAQQAGVAAVAAGAAYGDVDRACRSVLEARGLAEAFTHGVGHGIGLEIHELPLRSRAADCILRKDFVVTVEPGAYVPGFGGVRVEDSVVVEADGCRPITRSPHDLVPF